MKRQQSSESPNTPKQEIVLPSPKQPKLNQSPFSSSSSTASPCFDNVIVLMTEQKKLHEGMLAEKAKLSKDLESEKARACQAELGMEMLKKKITQLEGEKLKLVRVKAEPDQQAMLDLEDLETKYAILEVEKRKVEEKLAEQTQQTKNVAISATQCYHILTYVGDKRPKYVDVSDGNGIWKNLAQEPLLSSRFKLQQNVDGTVSIYSIFKGKFLEYKNNKANGFGLTENCSAMSAKFEFQFEEQQKEEEEGETVDNMEQQQKQQQRMFKIRSMSSKEYLNIAAGGFHKNGPHSPMHFGNGGMKFALVPTAN